MPVDPPASSFDYIIVGSGAGGGPLAARLALAGKRVLVLDAGADPTKERSATYPEAEPGEVTAVPAYHAAATEDLAMSWQFSVRHFADPALQQRDAKYNAMVAGLGCPRFRDPATMHPPGIGAGGILYPRSAGIGGCTAHHAMIVAVPNDKDWNDIADLTGDESWRASRMRGYFARLERCLYVRTYQTWLQTLLGPLYIVWQWLVLQFDPRAALDQGGHGTRGWQPTSFIDPQLIEGISSKDRGFTSVLVGAALAVLHRNNRLIGLLKRSLVWARVVQHIDPNDLNTRRTSPEGVFLIPTAIESGDARDEAGTPLLGKRAGVREFLLATQARHPERLVIKTRSHVTRILFAPPGDDGAPTAIGVEVAEGEHLYEASALRPASLPAHETVRHFVREGGEVILCGGAFNTPQLLQLSGIGDVRELVQVAPHAGHECVLHGADGTPLFPSTDVRSRVDLPGVGCNLQDRYEVSVISELSEEFATLAGASFAPGDENDPIRREWLQTKGGLYRTNGGTLAVLRRSSVLRPDEPEPDLFTFGAPAAFRGYYWGWSRQLLRPTIDAERDTRNLWSWIILKAYTNNQRGVVRLRSADPFAQPNICFDSFNEAAEREAREIESECAPHRAAGTPIPPELAAQLEENRRVLAESRRDLAALVDAVGFMRKVNARNPERFTHEVQPGAALRDGTNELAEWIRTQAWGHHASCTCKMGSDPWRAATRELRDPKAVLDSSFRVHGVRRLRVVDASVFPKIPGYFILTPILMVSEKAADVLLEDARDEVYPAAYRATEAAAVRTRREKVRPRRNEDPEPATGPDHRLPADTIGLALSGGGIRSATFGLGVLQALAERDRLRDVDFLSTVSGGGFIGSFLGRLFTRELVARSMDPAGRVQETLTDGRSGPLRWLRAQANYIFASGAGDIRQSVGVLWRNLATVHLVIGALLFAAFGILAVLARTLQLPTFPIVATDDTVVLASPWWWLPLVPLALGVVPATFAYWLTPKPESYRAYPIPALFAWVLLLVGTLLALQFPDVTAYAYGALVVLLLAWIWQEAARWGAPAQDAGGAAVPIGTIVRNRLTRGLGEAGFLFALLVAFVVLDTVATASASTRSAAQLAALMVALTPVLPLLRIVGMNALRQVSSHGTQGFNFARAAKFLGIPIAILLLWVLDAFAHQVVVAYPHAATYVVGLAVAFSMVVGRAFDFLNLSTLRATYGARLARTFLGASNPERVYGAANDETQNVDLVHPADDVPHDQYHPERNGGPIHLINVCVNETVDSASEREVRERKGLSMCVTPHGVGVGRRYFAAWAPPDALPRWQKFRRWLNGIDGDDDKPAGGRRYTALRALPIGSDPNAFHVLQSKSSESAEVEPLSLAAWTSISGAAFTTGVGRGTSLPFSLFMGLTNIRLGYWWDSGILPHERPARYPLPLWRKLKRLPSKAFAMQSMLLAEWRARFRGPSEWFWYLSDGGHFEVTGLYELIRRRVPLMIVSDAGEDPSYCFADLSQLTQQVRIDFGAEIEWLDPPFAALPPLITTRFFTWAFGPIRGISRTSLHNAALAKVTWHGSDDTAWIVLLKPGVGSPVLSQDVVSHAAQHGAFPQDSTFDQVFDDNQWESYRALGRQITRRALL